MQALEALVERHQLRRAFSDSVHEEVAALVASPGLDDRSLVDRRSLPFITIDNEDSRDLDQALCIQRVVSGGYAVFYALADASYYVRPGGALFVEAVRRAASYYLPGFSVPMLPRALCEGIVGEKRRALLIARILLLMR